MAEIVWGLLVRIEVFLECILAAIIVGQLVSHNVVRSIVFVIGVFSYIMAGQNNSSSYRENLCDQNFIFFCTKV